MMNMFPIKLLEGIIIIINLTNSKTNIKMIAVSRM